MLVMISDYNTINWYYDMMIHEIIISSPHSIIKHIVSHYY